MKKRTGSLTGLLICACLLAAGPALAQTTPGGEGGSARAGGPADHPSSATPTGTIGAPTGVSARDTPNDGGGSVSIRWQPVSGALRYRIERAEGAGGFDSLDVAGPTATRYADQSTSDRNSYRYRVIAIGPAGPSAPSEPSPAARSRPQWFNTDLLGVALALLTFTILILYLIGRARKGIHLFVRRIAGLEAVDEAVGRATEMGRALLYVPGSGMIQDIATIASLNLLGEVAKKTAQYGTTLRVPVRDPIVFTVAREVVSGAYTTAGRPDAYDPESVFFLVENALAYAGGVSGIMVREKPATNFLMGTFGGESLILSETGATTGAIQIAGTDETTQLPFFIVSCDYTLIGEELYAASAYIAREPLMLGALKGQDYSKLLLLLLLILATVISLVGGIDVGKALLSTSGR